MRLIIGGDDAIVAAGVVDHSWRVLDTRPPARFGAEAEDPRKPAPPDRSYVIARLAD